MYFIYMDESGSDGFDPVQHFFVLVAVVVDADQCLTVQGKLKKLKEEFSLGNVEIKGRDIEQKKKLFKHISYETRKLLVKRLFEFLFAHNITLFSVVFSKEEESIRRLNLSAEEIYHYTYRKLLDHLLQFLDSNGNNGMLLVDSRASSIRSHLKDDRLIHFHKSYLDQLTREGKKIRIIEYPVFVQSEFFASVQLADLCGYYIFKALQIRFGQPFLKDRKLGKMKYMSPIDHRIFQDKQFINSLFSHPDINLPVFAKIINQKGRIEKLP